ncbi:MAG: hypothetical protein JWQ39_2165 [Glaciihabitans sp.]|nr:hypothetical protein [Glaciihabitans sp.]
MTPKTTDPAPSDDADQPAAPELEARKTADGFTLIDPPGMERFRISGQLWHGTVDFVAAIPDSTIWRSVPGNPVLAERLRAKFHNQILQIAPDLRIYERGIGAFLTVGDVTAQLQVTEEQLKKLVRSGRLLAIRHGAMPPTYPQIQFDWDGRVLPGLPPVLKVLKSSMNGWEIARWLATPTESGQSPATLLFIGGSETVMKLAREIADETRVGGANETSGRRPVRHP